LTSTNTVGALGSAVPSVAMPGFGPRVPVGPLANVTCPAGSILLSPGANVASIVRANTGGKTYCLAAGTYALQQIIPRTGDTFVGLKGATLDGGNSAAYAFAGSGTGVTVKNLVVQNYASPLQTAAVSPQGGGTGWIIENNEVTHNAAAGIGAQSGAKITANYIHDNGEEGYTIHGSGVSFTDNEISHNNPSDAVSPSFEAGGGKAWATTNLNVSYNFSHDNHGPGLWTDTDNAGTVYEYNDVVNNWASGIFHEISWDAKIDHNFVSNNASLKYCGGTFPFFCSEIRLADSGGEPGTTIDLGYNTVTPNSMNAAIGLANSARGAGLYGVRQIENVHVHNNTIDLSAGSVTGVVDESGNDTPALFTTQGNSLDYDAYTGAGKNAFYWNGLKNSFAALQALGQERHGTSN
jgi:hypothetical protein